MTRSGGDGRGTPAERVDEAVARWGEDGVVAGCVSLLRSREVVPVDGQDQALVVVLGGLERVEWLAEGKPPGHAYWSRVWAARALTYVWRDTAATAVVEALGDEHWRVREMAARVVAQRELADAVAALAGAADDEVPRVRAAVARAVGEVGEGEDAELLRELQDDPDERVTRAATAALERLARRLDRPV